MPKAHPNALFVYLCLCFLFPKIVYAQNTGVIVVSVTESRGLIPLDGASVSLLATRYSSVSDRLGLAHFNSVSPGTYTLQVAASGYLTRNETVTVVPGDTTLLSIALVVHRPSMSELPTPDVQPYLGAIDSVRGIMLEGVPVPDIGEILRRRPGVNAIRRGGRGLDPLVRALAETEVGVLLDGARRFASDPYRSDAPSSQFDPQLVARVEVLKGPFALTKGAGVMSVIDVHSVLDQPAPERTRATVRTGYLTNLHALETAATFRGGWKNISFGLHGAFQRGNDYAAGNGHLVPADYRAWNARGRFGIRFNDETELSVSAGHHRQDETDEPALPLSDASSHVTDVMGHYRIEAPRNAVRTVDISLYWNRVTHGTNGDGKLAIISFPPDINPPDPLRIDLDATLSNVGGRAAVQFVTDEGIAIDVGSDFYQKRQRARRRTRNAVSGALLNVENVLPNVRTTDLGLFFRGVTLINILTVSVAARVDLVRTNASNVSDFFLRNAAKKILRPDNLDRRENNLSLALSFALPVSRAWTVSAGLGSIIRTADALERYGDRFPSSRSFNNVEVLGRPDQEPERASEADLSVSGRYPNLRVSLSSFARLMSDYTTFLPTSIPSRDSTDRIFRYRSGEGRFRGFEAEMELDLLDLPLTLFASGDYLWGKDVTLDEPAFGVSPASSDVGIRYHDDSFFAGGNVRLVARQYRVAAFRNEPQTDGYTTIALHAGIRLRENLHTATVTIGVENLFDELYAIHTNAINPSTQSQLAEPGRSFYLRARVEF